MRVMIVDDSLLVREGLSALLTRRGHTVVGVAETPSPVPALVRASTPDVVLVDIKMPPTFTDEGLRLAAGLRAQHPDIGVLVLSQYVVGSYVASLLADSHDGVGYLLKDNILRPEILDDAIDRVGTRGAFVDPTLVARMVAADTSLAALSDREREVLSLMAEGLSDRGIAEKLVVSLQTVYTHVQHVFTKLDLPTSSSDNRRVRAVVAYLVGTPEASTTHPPGNH
ncbi:response regulator transcription factor [Microbacterium sp. SS28]|uniref:response regulator n=1 Tax=Microbacterium sp. SS28 TaxID=2919948 RepID=UPI001FA9FC4A|nr:response regulator transcription factor [Microbacterium sp. SS28]